MDLDKILKLSVEGLKGKLAELGLPTTWRKQDLQDRLKDHFEIGNKHSDAINDDVSSQHVNSTFVRSNLFILKDIKDSLISFCGDDRIDIIHWVEDFKDNAYAVGWYQFQKFIYAKQLLKGVAHMLIWSQSGLKSWRMLKDVLIEEFGTTLAAINVHRRLKSRKKKSTESHREYFYTLMDFGKPIQLDESCWIQCFVDGIPDSKFGKSVLYQVRNIEYLKENIKTYEKIRGS